MQSTKPVCLSIFLKKSKGNSRTGYFFAIHKKQILPETSALVLQCTACTSMIPESWKAAQTFHLLSLVGYASTSVPSLDHQFKTFCVFSVLIHVYVFKHKKRWPIPTQHFTIMTLVPLLNMSALVFNSKFAEGWPGYAPAKCTISCLFDLALQSKLDQHYWPEEK